jgi:hypothetical protein
LGLVLGGMSSLMVGRLLAGRVAGLVPLDAALYLVIPLLLGVAGLLGCLPPAVRAARLPPSTALREV